MLTTVRTAWADKSFLFVCIAAIGDCARNQSEGRGLELASACKVARPIRVESGQWRMLREGILFE